MIQWGKYNRHRCVQILNLKNSFQQYFSVLSDWKSEKILLVNNIFFFTWTLDLSHIHWAVQIRHFFTSVYCLRVACWARAHAHTHRCEGLGRLWFYYTSSSWSSFSCCLTIQGRPPTSHRLFCVQKSGKMT